MTTVCSSISHCQHCWPSRLDNSLVCADVCICVHGCLVHCGLSATSLDDSATSPALANDNENSLHVCQVSLGSAGAPG